MESLGPSDCLPGTYLLGAAVVGFDAARKPDDYHDCNSVECVEDGTPDAVVPFPAGDAAIGSLPLPPWRKTA